MERKWWKEAVVYQIYPRSFKDTDGDGVGDLRGIIEKLDYLQALGIDVVWLSPVYRSPNDDNGYDICDYRNIMDEFGTLADWEAMLAGMHARGIRLVMDLVVNHTSDEHPWFQESRKSKDNPYRDYYIWRPGRDGGPPNNWQSWFSGPAWEYDALTGEYYLHLFSKKQPDLNWENPRVRAEVYDLMHFWLRRGVDGFRMDVINMISKAPGLPDADPSRDRYPSGASYFINGPRLHEFLGEMKREVLSQYDLLTVGETPKVSVEDAIALTDAHTGYLNMLFQFEHMDLDAAPGVERSRRSVHPWRLADLKEIMSRWQYALEGKAWNSLYLSNHDQPRQVSRFGDDSRYRLQSAKLLGMFLHTLQGTPYIYQGEEIGMTNVAFDSIEDYRDIETRNLYRELVVEQGMDAQKLMAVFHAKSRDNARTPMQWSAAPQAGFTSGEPWIQVNPNHTQINVEQALADPDSIFAFYQRLIRLRRENPVMVYGRYDLILGEHPTIYAYTRTLDDDRLLVMLNFSAGPAVFELPQEIAFHEARLMLANYPGEPGGDLRRMELRPYEARLYRVK